MYVSKEAIKEYFDLYYINEQALIETKETPEFRRCQNWREREYKRAIYKGN